MASNEVRIIGGNWRGRKIGFPDRPHLRPTLGRVRETLFNWLVADVPGRRCLDLFAGSGAIGFEAASRGAAAVTLVESDPLAVRRLKENAVRLGAEQVTVVFDRAERLLSRREASWDIIFLDPPFAGDHLAPILDLIRSTGALAADGLVYVEAPRREALPTAGWREVRQSKAGDTRFGLLAAP